MANPTPQSHATDRFVGLALPPVGAPVAQQPVASRRIADVLGEARERLFVGRRAERQTFESALASAPVRVLWVHGPGGVGKTELLRAFERLGRDRGHASVWTDWGASEQERAPTGGSHRGLDGHAVPVQRPVVFIDAHGGWGAPGEAGLPLVSLLRHVPGDALVVVASRLLPGSAVLETATDGDVRLLRLGGFEPAEARAVLCRRGVPDAHHAGALALAQGYPFALALVAAGYARALAPGATLDAEPTLTYALLDRLVGPDAGPEIMDALGVAAMVPVLSEPVLAAGLGRAGVHDVFAALRALPAAEPVLGGVRVRGIARDALTAELRWRNRERYDAVRRRLRAHFAEQARAATPESVLNAVVGYAATCDVSTDGRPSPTSPRAVDAGVGLTPLQPAAPADHADAVAAVRARGGAAEAVCAARWVEAQPGGLRTARAGARSAFAHVVDVAERPAGPLDADLRETDPVVRAVWNAVERASPLREGERLSVLRFWSGATDATATGQAPSAELWPVFADVLRHAVAFPRPAATVLTCADPEVWRPAFERAGFRWLAESQTAGAFWHDWRAVPVEAWLSWLVDGAAATDACPGPPEPLAVFDKAGFAGAVRDALRDFALPHVLVHNPLLQSHLAGRAGSTADRAEALRSRIRAAAEVSAATCAGARHAPALDAYFLRPSGTQVEVAERLGLSFSTFRRTLDRGTAGITETMWQWECGEAQSPCVPA